MRMRVLDVVVAAVMGVSLGAWPGVALAKYSGGAGEPNDPYLIGDVNDLHALAADTGDYGKHFRLIADIDLDPNLPNRQVYITAVIGPDTNSSSSGFQGTFFTGSFDGNGKRIVNLRIDTGGAGNDCLGLFGYINGWGTTWGEIKNIGIESVFIAGGPDSETLGGLCGASYYGRISNCYTAGEVIGGANSERLAGLCGSNSCGTISNCSTACQVSGGEESDSVGGLCGENHGGISDCYSTGKVTCGDSPTYLGGLCGFNYEGTISNCHSTSEITGGTVSRYVGGLCGDNSRYSTISNCYSSGDVSCGTSSNSLGGLCGENGAVISYCYATGEVRGGPDSQTIGGLCGKNYEGTISNCFATGSVGGWEYLGGLCGWNSYGTISKCYSTGEVTGTADSEYLGGLCGRNYEGTVSNCYFYLFSGWDNHLGTDLDAGQMIESNSYPGFDFAGNADDGTEEHWSITAGHLPKLSWQTGDGPLPPSYVPDTNLSGGGRADDPFQINNMADFTEFIANDELDCGYYAFTCDIDLSGQSFATAVISRYFGGHLDGRGYRIANITIDTGGESTDYLGMFSRLGGSICNLGIENISITGGDSSRYLGGLCGYNSYGMISHCYCTGEVTGGDNSADVGGLCGYNRYGIRKCRAVAFVANGVFLGGLCGSNGGAISNCYATGQVAGGDSSGDVGGLCGWNFYGAISKCYASGSVNGGNGSVSLGGLCGENFCGAISDCYSTGGVTGGASSSYLGGLCGFQHGGSAEMDACFWDMETSGMSIGYNLDAIHPGTVTNVFGKTTAEMQTESTFTDAGWDFAWDDGDEADWFIQVGENPILVWQIGPGDIYTDGRNNLRDWAVLANWWMREDCGIYNYYCEWADLDFSGDVGVEDLAELARYWLEAGIYD